MDFQNVSKENIWNYKQNKPSLIVKDLKQHGLDEETIYKILLSRGVFKWLAVRRDLIKLKNVWKDRIKATLANIALQKKENNPYKLGYTRGYLKAYEDWQENVFGKSWMMCNGNPACLHYAVRSTFADLPLDNNVVYGKVGAFGHIVHESELGEVLN